MSKRDVCRRFLGGLLCWAGLSVAVMSAGCEESASPALRINGSTTVNLPVAEAAEVMREHGMRVTVDTQGGSSGGIAAVGDQLAEIGMSSKALKEADRQNYVGVDFRPVSIGADAVALVVSRDVYEGGIRALTRQQMQDIYEGRATNWQQLGGADQRIVFFNKEPGRGTWEVFAKWLYGDADDAPAVSFPEVGGNEETRNKVSSTRGAISQLSASWADSEAVHALTIDGIEPASANIAAGTYPMSRPLFLITDGPPTGDSKTFIDFMLSDDGQAIVRDHGYLSLDQLSE